jgi:hypothetical protein
MICENYNNAGHAKITTRKAVERGDPAAPHTPPLTSKGSPQPAAAGTTM